MPPHSVALAIARTASEPVSHPTLPSMKAKFVEWDPAPDTPPSGEAAPSRMSSLPDLAYDSSDSSSDEDEAGPLAASVAAAKQKAAPASAAAASASARAAAAVMQAKGSAAGGSDAPLPPQPLLWMRGKCHWQVDRALAPSSKFKSLHPSPDRQALPAPASLFVHVLHDTAGYACCMLQTSAIAASLHCC